MGCMRTRPLWMCSICCCTGSGCACRRCTSRAQCCGAWPWLGEKVDDSQRARRLSSSSLLHSTDAGFHARRRDPGSSLGRVESPSSQVSVGEVPLLGPRRGGAAAFVGCFVDWFGDESSGIIAQRFPLRAVGLSPSATSKRASTLATSTRYATKCSEADRLLAYAPALSASCMPLSRRAHALHTPSKSTLPGAFLGSSSRCTCCTRGS